MAPVVLMMGKLSLICFIVKQLVSAHYLLYHKEEVE
jgi:hypothetical protein